MKSWASGSTDHRLAPIMPLVRRTLLGIGVVSAFLNVLLLAGSLYMMLVYDLVIPGRSIPTLIGLLLMVVAAYVFQGLLDAVRGQLLVHLASNVDSQLEAKAHDLVVTLARLYPAQDPAQPIRDIDQVRGFLGGAGPTALVDLPWVLFFVAVLFLLHPWLGVTVLAGAAVLIALTLLTDRVTQSTMAEIVRLNRERQQAIDTSRRHAEAIHAMGMQDQLKSIWRTANGAYRNAQVNLSARASLLVTAGRIFRLFLQSGVLTVGTLLVLSGKASGGVIFASSILSSRALAPIESAIANWRGFVAARQSWQRLGDIMSFDGERRPQQLLPLPSQSLAAEALTLAPPGSSEPTVRGVSFLAYAGEAVAVLGPSGSGKSTLLRGLAGGLPPVSGDVRLDGATMTQWSRDRLGRDIGYLPQNVELLPGTIAENIARFDPAASADLVLTAAEQAGVTGMIQALPEGYSTQVGIDGRRLSGGQRQRIALARALYGAPFLILLDEPNANLDADGEAALINAIRGVKARGGIVVLVAHRPSVLVAVDNVLALRDGKAVSYGPQRVVLLEKT
ncbi:type I secretion system permease/ATPase [Sphingomonas sp. IC-11]|uniref:type I secretion system permease/ATPase n=1 Tax=Sphingomonas sp. IC-11 TaxID=2898528 RepID=UPI001E38DCFF|nr:type I secretion system permease/ATPase [Sphingomonas sp. IC-11]MCD2315043.1 type I secretion system permease/ATPase [Sphingomonas sp. IC-11]